jgi:hypothetical protein
VALSLLGFGFPLALGLGFAALSLAASRFLSLVIEPSKAAGFISPPQCGHLQLVIYTTS